MFAGMSVMLLVAGGLLLTEGEWALGICSIVGAVGVMCIAAAVWERKQ